MTKEDLRDFLANYKSTYKEESEFIPKFKKLLEEPLCYERALLTGHLTASTWVTNSTFTEVLLMHHKKLNKWLQPGGHADGNENLKEVAIKELDEETGLKTVVIKNNEIFDLDIHTIPERKGIPEHQHFDVRFHLIALNPKETTKNEESLELKWIPTEEVLSVVDDDQSFVRMMAKMRSERGAI